MIEAKGLTRNFGDFAAVDSVSFAIAPGEVVGLLGHNGAGKTTIMRMIAGVLEPTAGQILVDGMDASMPSSEIQRKMGYLPENCPLYPEMTIVDYLEYTAQLKGIAPAGLRHAIGEAIMRTDLRAKAKRPISTLSRGYRQRVGVAQAILGNPKILILDEPTNGLDPSQIQQMRGLISDFSRAATVIVSTHILREVEAVCGRVLILRAGRLAVDSLLKDVRSSRRLLLSIDHGPEEALPALGRIKNIERVDFLGGEGVENRYALTPASTSGAAGLAQSAPALIEAATKLGMRIYAVGPEKRGLEKVFDEVNSADGGTDYAA